MIWCFDIDGVITANPPVFAWLTYHLKKKGNNNTVYVLSARNPGRREVTKEELRCFGIHYDELITMPEGMPRDYKSQALWKLEQVALLQPDVWMDNEFKIYEKVLGVPLNTPGTERVEI